MERLYPVFPRGVFSKKEGRQRRHSHCIQAVSKKIVSRELPLPSALALLSDKEFTDGLIEEARKGLKEQAQELERLASIEAYLLEMTNKVSSVADITTAILSQNEKLAKENALLHEKLDRSNELLVAAKKRAIRYFKIGLMVSASSIAIGIAMRYGAFDVAKNWVSELTMTKQSTGKQTNLSLFQPSFLNKAPPKSGFYGFYNEDKEGLFDSLNVGRTIILQTDRGPIFFCVRPPSSSVCKQTNPAHSRYEH